MLNDDLRCLTSAELDQVSGGSRNWVPSNLRPFPRVADPRPFRPIVPKVPRPQVPVLPPL